MVVPWLHTYTCHCGVCQCGVCVLSVFATRMCTPGVHTSHPRHIQTYAPTHLPADAIAVVQQQPTPDVAPPTTSNRQQLMLHLRHPPKDLYASDCTSRMIPHMPVGQGLVLVCDMEPQDAETFLQQLKQVGFVGGVGVEWGVRGWGATMGAYEGDM